MTALLEVDSVCTGYGDTDVVTGVCLRVDDREIVTLIGPNGAGKSTVLKAIVGLLAARQGRIHFAGRDITGLRASSVVKQGISYVPQTQNVFPSLTVLENLEMGAYLSRARIRTALEADIAALPSVNQQQRALAERVDEAARRYISGPLKDLLTKEIAAVEDATDQRGHFSLGFGFDPYRNRDALDILVVGYKSVFDINDGYVQAAVRIEGGARPDPVPAELREIVPYIASEMPAGHDLTARGVTTVRPERTFWEKATLLHALHHGTLVKPDRRVDRLSRHLYDLHLM